MRDGAANHNGLIGFYSKRTGGEGRTGVAMEDERYCAWPLRRGCTRSERRNSDSAQVISFKPRMSSSFERNDRAYWVGMTECATMCVGNSVPSSRLM
jgi:hypothetical protein